ncbi:MAG TPA: sulfite exporter TauE/SafE family protein, partial [Burkholderiales bacterium]
MTWTALTAMSAIVVFAGFVQGSTGVGFALVVAPVLGLVAPQMLPVTVLILMLPLNIYVAWRERVALDFRSGAWVTAGRLAGTFAGLWVLVALSASHLNLLIGISTVAAAAVTLAMPAFRPSRGVYVAAGLVTGVTETATGIGGPPLALVYQHHPVAVMRS